MRITAGVRSLLRAGVETIYPSYCPRCGTNALQFATPTKGLPRLCHPCAASLAPPVADFCRRCGAPVGPHLDTSGGCLHCCDDRFAFDTVIALGVYRNELRSACLRAKQPGSEILTAALATLLWERNSSTLQDGRFDAVVPVPRHWTDRLGRRHHSPGTLGRALARLLQIRFDGRVLRKVRRTPRQANLTVTERRANLRNAFRARRSKRLAGRRILLVDDVLTTGTTAHRTSRLLRQAGAASVSVAVLARGIGGS
ncbi:MAG: hypothetical protein KY476_14510 [Planctomycetes bacterium]|nr:hypothetical protein [Planctomycetota bacterium]